MSSQDFLYDIPAGIMEEFYNVMDTLVDVVWMRFASCIITNQTELRSIESFGRRDHSRTKELIWVWGMRQGTVRQLLDLLNDMQLYRAISIILSWKPESHFITQPRSQKIPSPQPCETRPTPTFASSQVQKDPTNNERLPHPLPSQEASSSERKSPCESGSEDSNGSFLKMGEVPNVPVQEADRPNRAWTLQDLRRATNNFDERRELGRGTFSHVYRGRRFNTDYAIKWLKESENINHKQVQDLFHEEVRSLNRFRHPNILALEGFCADCSIYCLIYRFMPNGSLENSLQNTNAGHGIPWSTRVKIALGTARAIQYLHSGDVPRIHGNVKSSNILLDEYFTPKLGDFGLVKTACLSTGSTAVKTKTLQRLLAYLSDEYMRHRQLSVKVDTFSFGIVLSEILTGMKAIDESRKPVFLKDLMLEELEAAKETRSVGDVSYNICQNYLDSKGGPVPLTVTVNFAEITCLCLRKKRPEMMQVYVMLERLEHQLQGLSSVPEEVQATVFKFKQPTSCPQENTEVFSPSPKAQPLDSAIFKYLPETSSPTPAEELPRTPCESDESDSFGPCPVPTRLAPLSSAGSCCSAEPTSTRRNSGFDSCSKAIEETSSPANGHDCGGSWESTEALRGFDPGLLQPNRFGSRLDWSGVVLSPPDSRDLMVNVLTPTKVNNSHLSVTSQPLCGNSNVALSPGSALRSACQRTVSNTASQQLQYSPPYTSCQSSFVDELSHRPRRLPECASPSSTHSTVGEFFTCSDLTINPHKKKLLDKILLYEEEQIDSAQLLSVHSLPEEG